MIAGRNRHDRRRLDGCNDGRFRQLRRNDIGPEPTTSPGRINRSSE
jgi:hypothetical protein